MWQSHNEALADSAGQKIKLVSNGQIPTFGDVVQHWRQDHEFRSFFNSLLVDAPFEAYRWETPAVTASTTNREFEFVLLDCPGLLTNSDPNAFAEHFRLGAGGDKVVTFSNLGKDAILVVPLPLQPKSAYGHLSAFVRTAPEQQLDALWRNVGEAMQNRINEKPVWLSTAGMGVPWLHVRLDDRP